MVNFFFPAALAADSAPGMHLPVYEGDDLVVSADEANQIFDHFFGKGRAGLGTLTELDRSFAQALYVEGLRRTDQIGWIQALWGSKGSIPKLGVRLGKRFFQDDDGAINVTVQRVLTENWRPEYFGRAAYGTYPTYGAEQ